MKAAPDDAPALPDDAVEVARVLGAWGVKGGIKVLPYTSDPQALFSSKRWFLKPGAAPRPAGAPPLPALLRVVGAREHGDAIVATVHDVSDRTAAEALKGARIFVSRASFPTPAEDEFYWVDLIGLAVANRQGVVLGTVAGLIETGPHCVLRVLPPGAAAGSVEELIPFVAQYVDSVDLAGRRIAVDWEVDRDGGQGGGGDGEQGEDGKQGEDGEQGEEGDQGQEVQGGAGRHGAESQAPDPQAAMKADDGGA